MAAARPAVHVLATGGSISGLGPDRLDYILYPELGRKLSIGQMLERIPEARELAELSAEDLIRVGSSSIGPAEWLRLAQRLDALFRAVRPPQGVVITHGTATLEDHVVAARVLPLEDLARPGCLAELPLAVVEEQDVAAGAGQEEVGPAVVVDVGGGDAEAGGAVGQAGGAGDVLELELAPVAEKARAFRL